VTVYASLFVIFEANVDFTSREKENEVGLLTLLYNEVIWNEKKCGELLNDSSNSKLHNLVIIILKDKAILYDIFENFIHH
jgi:hypothetical protein